MKLWQYWFMRMYYGIFGGKTWKSAGLPPTLRWINTAGSLILETNTMDAGCIGGVNEEHQQKVLDSLDGSWDITDHDSAVKEITQLIQQGMRADFARDMARGGGDKKLRQLWESQGENALLGWDLCRAAYISSWCFCAHYLSLDEFMELAVTAGEQLQQHFESWDQAMESYLAGLWYWMEPEDAEDRRSYRLRVKLWKKLRRPGCGAYGVTAFFTPLTTQLTDAEKARLGVTHL